MDGQTCLVQQELGIDNGSINVLASMDTKRSVATASAQGTRSNPRQPLINVIISFNYIF
jgi:hypothetical protein